MSIALPRPLAFLHALRLFDNRPAVSRREKRRIDLCQLPPYLRRDLGFETFRCDTREDWRTFR